MPRFKTTIVFPGEPPCFTEFERAYQKTVQGLPEVSLDRLNRWPPDRPEWQDPAFAIVFWCRLPKVIPRKRAARCILYHLESSGIPTDLSHGQKALLEDFLERSRQPDLFLVTTPAAESFWAPRVRRVAVAPIGFDAETMGVPNWSQEKTHDVGYCGTLVGRREWILPILSKHLGPRLRIITECCLEMRRIFNSCRIMLHVAHSEEPGFPTLRIWQAISTSAALVTERRDAWPAVSGRHILQIPPARKEDPGDFLSGIEEALRMPLLRIARLAHEELSLYTVERSIKEFMIPAIEPLF